MRHLFWLALPLLFLTPAPGRARVPPFRTYFELDRVNRQLHGRVLDYTHNHGPDNRIWSPALCEKRDLYVYLPPCYDPHKQYPLLLWLHAFAEDEMNFLPNVVVPLDKAIACGQLPPMIIAAPDGSVRGRAICRNPGSFFVNSEAGAFEDYLMIDLWNFLFANFPLRPEREAHAVGGVSMGGGAAYAKAIKYHDRFRIVFAFFPPVNIRWMDCHGNYRANFDPNCWAWRTDFEHRHVLVGSFYLVFRFYLSDLLNPLFSRHNPDTLEEVIKNNPIEMLGAYNIQPGQLEMYIAYGRLDQFNMDAQIESFLYVAHQRGLEVGVSYDPKGHHDRATAERLRPAVLEWLAPRLWAFAPPGYQPGHAPVMVAPPAPDGVEGTIEFDPDPLPAPRPQGGTNPQPR